MQILMINYVKQ